MTRADGTLAGDAEHDGGISGASRAQRVLLDEWGRAWISRRDGGDLRGTAKLAAVMASTPLPPLGSLPSPLATNLLEACLSLNSGWCGVVLSHTEKGGADRDSHRYQRSALGYFVLCTWRESKTCISISACCCKYQTAPTNSA